MTILKKKILGVQRELHVEKKSLHQCNEIPPQGGGPLGHSDTLTLDMIDKSTDMFIAHCDCSNKGVGVALIVNTTLNPKQIRMNTILETVVVEISEPIQMIVISVYRPPSTPIDVFKNHV